MLVALLLAALAWRPAGAAAGGGSCVQLQRSEPRYDQDNWATYQAQLKDEVSNVDTGPVCTGGPCWPDWRAYQATAGVSEAAGGICYLSDETWHMLQGSTCKRRRKLTSSTTV